MRKGSLTLGLMMLGLLTATFPAVGGDATARTTLTIKGMTCGGCTAGVKIQLKRTQGVTAYEVSFEKGEAEVSYNPAKTTPEKIAASVSKTGFAASVKKPGADKDGDGAVEPARAARRPARRSRAVR
jgi:copper chaperone CopZ